VADATADAAPSAPQTSLTADALAAVAARLRPATDALARRYPGESGARQPVQTYYLGAHLVAADTPRRLGRLALDALAEYAPDAATLADAIGLPRDEGFAQAVYARVADKLRREPVEDLRVDYEDGYGVRPDAEEDEHATSVARLVARGAREKTLPPFVGIRVKPLTAEHHARSLRTLDIFVTTLVAEAGGLPERFVLTLPKISVAEQAAAFADALDALERRLGLEEGALRFEAMVETPQLVGGADGRSALPALVDAARGRLAAAHLGVYDYTASLGITAAHQRLRHGACDFARHATQVAFAGTGVWLSDGSTAVLPAPVHRPRPGGAPLGERERAENRASVLRAWRLHYEDVRHSLAHGFYQGWDLHPAQLVTRYAAVYAFFLEGAQAAAERLRAFVEKASQTTLAGDVFEDAATGQALLNFLLRAVSSGALPEAEVVALTGLTADELRGRSITQILAGRQGRGARGAPPQGAERA
jgi:citrate lyase beta subunit